MSFDIIDSTRDTFCLQKAILLYGRRDSFGYASLHDVAFDSEGKSMVCAGTPLTSEALVQINRSLSESLRQKHFGFIPENVLVNDDGLMIWYVPAQRRSIYFDSRELIGQRAGVVDHPALIFALQGDSWSVFAYKEDGRPSPSTRLYHAPYFNVWDSGRICVGSVSVPEESGLHLSAAWTDAFFESYFTHTNHTNLVDYPGGAHRFWLDHLSGSFPTFPAEVLVAHPIQTLGDFYSSHSEK